MVCFATRFGWRVPAAFTAARGALQRKQTGTTKLLESGRCGTTFVTLLSAKRNACPFSLRVYLLLAGSSRLVALCYGGRLEVHPNPVNSAVLRARNLFTCHAGGVSSDGGYSLASRGEVSCERFAGEVAENTSRKNFCDREDHWCTSRDPRIRKGRLIYFAESSLPDRRVLAMR